MRLAFILQEALRNEQQKMVPGAGASLGRRPQLRYDAQLFNNPFAIATSGLYKRAFNCRATINENLDWPLQKALFANASNSPPPSCLSATAPDGQNFIMKLHSSAFEYRTFLLPFVIAVYGGALGAPAQDLGALNRDHPGGLPTTNRVSITVEGEYRVIRANGLPDHTPGRFPNAGNPNAIAPQRYNFRVPVNPKPVAEPTAFNLGIFGIAINGVVFDPGAAEWWNQNPTSGWQYEPLTSTRKLGVDENNAHVQPTGAYHYHGLPIGLLARIKGARQRMILIGWAADGFPMYAPWAYSDPNDLQSPLKQMNSSYRLKTGIRPSGPGGAYDGSFVKDFEFVAGAGDLDECNGRFSVTPEFPGGTYQYYVTTNFPFIPRMFHGTPDPSFVRRRPPLGGPRGGFGPRGRPPG
jgi:YHYH protein